MYKKTNLTKINFSTKRDGITWRNNWYMKSKQTSKKWEPKWHRQNGEFVITFVRKSHSTKLRVTAQVEKNFDASKKQLAIVERKRAAGVDMKLGKVQIKQRKVVGGSGGGAKESKKSQLASILFSWINPNGTCKAVVLISSKRCRLLADSGLHYMLFCPAYEI